MRSHGGPEDCGTYSARGDREQYPSGEAGYQERCSFLEMML